MSDTMNFAMPLLDAAQAQKHVTVNEALVRADVLGAARVEARDLTAPPGSPVDGQAWIVAAGGSGDWAGHDDELALFLNGGWAFVAPWAGARFWVVAEAVPVIWTGTNWKTNLTALSPGGATTAQKIVEVDHTLAVAATSTTAAIIPDKAVVFGVTGRVTTEITGATGWSLGVSGATTRYGSGYGTTLAAFAHGVSGQPQAYYGGTALEITAEGGSFTAGAIRLAVHCLEIAPPA